MLKARRNKTEGFSNFDEAVLEELTIAHEKKQKEKMLEIFSKYAFKLGNRAYWLLLAMVWQVAPGFGNTSTITYRELFSSGRLGRKNFIMTPEERAILKSLFSWWPWSKTMVYRVKAVEETAWIDYVVDLQVAKQFADQLDVEKIMCYEVKKKDVAALFYRKGFVQLIVPDQNKVRYVKSIFKRQEDADAARGSQSTMPVLH